MPITNTTGGQQQQHLGRVVEEELQRAAEVAVAVHRQRGHQRLGRRGQRLVEQPPDHGRHQQEQPAGAAGAVAGCVGTGSVSVICVTSTHGDEDSAEKDAGRAAAVPDAARTERRGRGTWPATLPSASKRTWQAVVSRSRRRWRARSRRDLAAGRLRPWASRKARAGSGPRDRRRAGWSASSATVRPASASDSRPAHRPARRVSGGGAAGSAGLFRQRLASGAPCARGRPARCAPPGTARRAGCPSVQKP